MKFFANIIAQAYEIKRLTFERDIYREQVDQLKDENRKLRAMVSAEVNSNRQREDGLIGQIVIVATGQRAQTGRRAALAESDELPSIDIEVIDDGIGPLTTVDAEFEATVTDIANQFAEQAAAKNVIYDENDLDVLKAKIRANPDEYFQ